MTCEKTLKDALKVIHLSTAIMTKKPLVHSSVLHVKMRKRTGVIFSTEFQYNTLRNELPTTSTYLLSDENYFVVRRLI